MEDDEAGVSNREESIGNLYLLLASFRYSWFHETVPSVAELKATKEAKSRYIPRCSVGRGGF